MRGFLVIVGVVLLLASCVLMRYGQHSPRVAPAICVKIVEENGWSGAENYVPAVEGHVSSGGLLSDGTSNGSVKSYEVTSSYKVTSSAPGHLFVLAHYVIERNGVSQEFDRALPVAGQTPLQADWTRLDDHLRTFAYMSDTTASY
jgi:hypothetical protein